MGEHKILRLMAALCLCGALVACGDSDSDSDDTGGKDAGAGTGGAGGAGGTGGTGGTGGGGGTLECGGETCPDLSAAMGFVDSCCTPSDACSIKLSTATECPEPPEPDECGTLDLVVVQLPRCCMDDGMCGVNVDQFQPGAGCVSNMTLSDMLPVDLPIPEKSCGGDGGVEDAGL